MTNKLYTEWLRVEDLPGTTTDYFDIQVSTTQTTLTATGGYIVFDDSYTSSGIPLADASNGSLTTTAQSIIGAINEIDAAGGGNVSNTGTPANNQLAVWTDATTIEGDSNITWDGSTLNITGALTASDTITANGNVYFNDWTVFKDDTIFNFGDSGEVKMEFYNGTTYQAFKIGLEDTFSQMIICHSGDIGTDFNHTTPANPTLFIQSADAASVNDYIALYHDQTNGNINTGAGNLTINPSTYTRIGDAATPTYATSADDLFCSDACEIEGNLYYNASVYYTGLTSTSTTGTYTVVAGDHIIRLTGPASTISLTNVSGVQYYLLYIKNSTPSSSGIDFENYATIDGDSSYSSFGTTGWDSILLYNVDGSGNWITLN